MRRWDDGCVDLIYLDPPFNSKTDYNVLYSANGAGDAQFRAFSDTWTWDSDAADRLDRYESAIGRRAHNAIMGLHRMLGPSGMLAYLTYMAERLEECHRLLKPTGSIYLHCDPTASHGLKLVMDDIFGPGNFRNEIVWKRTYSHGGARRWGPIHDILLFYSVSDAYQWNRVHQAYDPSYVAKYYRLRDKKGRYQLVSLTGAGTRNGASGQPWRGVNPTQAGRHWAVPAGALANVLEDHDPSKLSVQQKLDALDAAGLIYWPPKGKTPRQKRYLSEAPGVQIQDVVADIGPIARGSEYLGYPTQEPLALLERIIEASSNEGDMILDPFCGCGTAIDAAHHMGRHWAGIDISSFAIDLIRGKRLKDKTIPVKGIPYDLASAIKLAREQPFNFESWAVTRLPGFAPNTKQVADGGVDGRATLAHKPDDHPSRLALAQVKGGKFSLSALRDFIGVTERDKAALGYFVTLEPVQTKAAKKAVANTGRIRVAGYPYRRTHLWPISDYFDERLPPMPIMADPYSGKPLEQGTLF